MAIRFGDLSDRVQKLCFLAGAVARTQSCLYGSCARETFGSAGFRSRFANLRTAVTHSFGDD
jgi:hypothetical protein